MDHKQVFPFLRSQSASEIRPVLSSVRSLEKGRQAYIKQYRTLDKVTMLPKVCAPPDSYTHLSFQI